MIRAPASRQRIKAGQLVRERRNGRKVVVDVASGGNPLHLLAIPAQGHGNGRERRALPIKLPRLPDHDAPLGQIVSEMRHLASRPPVDGVL